MSWTTTSSLTEAKRDLAGCGTTSAALAFGGHTGLLVATTERWSGASWVTTSSLTEAKVALAGCGTTLAALVFGGNIGARVSTTEKWSGSSWSTTGSLTEAKQSLAGCGTTSAALAFGGNDGAVVAITEKWSGTSWVTTGSLTEAKYLLAGCGTSFSALAFGGSPTTATTEKWSDGSSLSGIVCNKTGTAITGIACNIDAYNRDTRTEHLGSDSSNSSDGSWSISDVPADVGTKTLVLFSYEGTYGDDTDIAGSEFITTV